MNAVIALGGSMSALVAAMIPEEGSFDSTEQVEPNRLRWTFPAGVVDVVLIRSGCRRLATALSAMPEQCRIVGLGYFGAIDQNVGLGDFLVPAEAVPLRGVPSGRGWSDPDVARSLVDSCSHVATTHVGVVATAPSFVTNDNQQIDDLRQEGVLGVDMETSCLLSWQHCRSMRIGALLVCSDLVTDPKIPADGPRSDRRLTLGVEAASAARLAAVLAALAVLDPS